MASAPIVTDDMSILHRGHFRTESSAATAWVADAPQCGQCRLPINIMAKHDEQAIVASFDSQYRHCGESDEMAAPQFGQLIVCASIAGAHASCVRCASILLANLFAHSA